jgi:hypothetical protein
LRDVPDVARHLWLARSVISRRKRFGTPMLERGLTWYEFQEIYPAKLNTPLSITFGEVATHNHFVLDRGGKVFKQTAPVIKLPVWATEDDHLGLLGLLNSSTGLFWLRQVCHNKGNGGLHGGIASDLWEKFLQINGSRLEGFPMASPRPIELARALDAEGQNISDHLPSALCVGGVPTYDLLNSARIEFEAARARMVALQEELDWRCYRLYGLHKAPPEHPHPPPLHLGERAFEFVMARRIAAGQLETAWFERHRSAAVTELPAHWPSDYRAIVESRIALIEANPSIGLIERPEYKRRWSSAPWEEMERAALRDWLLDRLEDSRFWSVQNPSILSARTLADAVRHDVDFLAVAELYTGRADFDLDTLVAELAARESVPFLAALRYTETGLRKRADWESTWERQRVEDAIDAKLAARRGEFVYAATSRLNPRNENENAEEYAARIKFRMNSDAAQRAADTDIAHEAKRRKQEEIGDMPIPPKYRPADFQSANYWRLRGGLDVPKERFVSFPYAARDAEPSLPILWAGHDLVARATAIAAWYVERKETEGWGVERLKPLLAGLWELVPWLRQWHNDVDPATGLRLGDYFAGYVEEQVRELGTTVDELGAWMPPAPPRRSRKRKPAA